MKKELHDIFTKSMYNHLELKANLVDCAQHRWENKEVLKEVTIYDGNSIENITYKDIELEISDKISLKGSSLHLHASTDIENVIPRPTPLVKVKLPFNDLSSFNRVKADIYIKAEGYQNFYFQFFVGNNGEKDHHSPSLSPNKWNQVIWEIDDIKRDMCEYLTIQPWLMGTPPEGVEDYDIYIDNISLQVVKPDHILGWELEERLAYSHIGYLPYSRKCVLAEVFAPSFSLVLDNHIVYEGKPQVNGKFYELDFSDVTKKGLYTLTYHNLSCEIKIDDDIYDESIIKSINFLYLLRCGQDIPGVHSACHLSCRTFDDLGRSVPIFGGWHDAGDVSQFEIPTAEMAHAICDLALVVKDYDLKERLKEEARIGLHWLMQTRFGDGTRALAITYNIWRKNVLNPDNLTPFKNKAENGPFENFLSAAALAAGYNLFKGSDDVFANWCKRTSISDFAFANEGYEKGIYTIRWGKTIDSVTLGHGIIAAVSLYQITKDVMYLQYAKKYASIVISCQEQDGVGDMMLKGFFYEDPKHEWILTYEHRGHEQSPIQGLVKLCEVFPHDEDYSKWYHAIKLYEEYVLKTVDITNPYRLLPGHVYILDKINVKRFTIPQAYGTEEEGLKILKNQARNGLKLGEKVYLRTFPIAVQRRGFHATLLSKVKAVSSIYHLTKSKELLNIITRQIEWIFGYNPFASSTMYGLGKNYHPLYVAFSRQMVGALPVGIETKGDLDEPFWPTRNHAVYKEIWGHTTGKYLWILADIINMEEENE